MKGFLFLALALLVSCASSNGQPKKTPAQKKADLHYTHGTSQLRDKNYSQALDNLIKANEYQPGDTKILNNLGMAYYFKKDLGNAIKYLQESISVDPKNSDARNNLASVYYNIGKLNEAQKHYEIIRKDLVYTSQYRVLYNLALIKFKRGDSRGARQLLNDAITENNSYCPSYFLMGRINEVARNFEEAYKSYRKAYLGICVNNPAPHFKAAESLFKLGKYEQAKAKYNEVVEKFPQSKFATLATEQVLKMRDNDMRTNNSEAYTRKMEEIEDEVRNFKAPGF